ncbi:hypothetical protein U8V72_21375 [Priestia filamentosa]|uniref:hypothetical protein n=1 Tax=Priestia filamentosa TaxID=1402861 RepID=UPI00397E7505
MTITYKRPYKFNELSEQARQRALLEVNKYQFKDFGEVKLHRLTTLTFGHINKVIEKAGIRHFKSWHANKDNIADITFYQEDRTCRSQTALKTLLDRTLSKELVEKTSFILSKTKEVLWSLDSLKGNSFSLKIKINPINEFTKLQVQGEVQQFISKYCPDEDISSSYKFKGLMFRANPKNVYEDDPEQLTKDFQVTVNHIIKDIEQEISKLLEKVQKEVNSIVEESYKLENQLEFCKEVMKDKLSFNYRGLWFAEDGLPVVTYPEKEIKTILKQEFEEEYKTWYQYQGYKTDNPSLYRDLYNGGYICCENDKNNLMAPLP